MFLIYDFIFFIYALVYLPYLLLTRRWYPGFAMRLGVFTTPIERQIKAKQNIWVHAVSVGEVMVLDGFIDQLRKVYPDYQVIATVTTKTGYELAQERLKNKALVIPSPIDFSFVVGYFVQLIKPKIYIAVETEIWPNLYRRLYRRKIPIGVINGRISDNSFGRYKAISFILKGVLNQVQAWCMQSQQDADRILELGAEASRVFVTGNVKFDDNSIDLGSSNAVGDGHYEELWWVAGSTHPGEEQIVLDVYAKIIKENPKWRLVIVPRHIERVPQILELIASRGLRSVKFTEIAASLKNARCHEEIIVVDTIGHLRALYAEASLVFVGKSLCVGGGHNVIEPACFSKAIVVGPRLENFRDIVACFKQANAIVQVEDVQAFTDAIKSLCLDASKREALGKAARGVIVANQGATKRSLDLLAGYFK